MTNRARPVMIAASSLALALLITVLNPQRTRVEEWSMATAYVAVLLLAVSLALGPLNLLRRRHNPTHNPVRRDFGIAAGVGSILHTVLGLQVHMGGSLSRYFTLAVEPSAPVTAFVLANYLGLVSAIVLLVLVAVSNNPSIRRLGLPRWKRTQRLAYVAAMVAAAHGFIYQALEKRSLPGVAVLVATFILVLLLQLRGRRHRTSSTIP